jgi:hypothetical protein
MTQALPLSVLSDPKQKEWCDMQELLTTRDRLIGKLRVSEQSGDLDVAALLEYGLAEFDGVIALLMSMTERGNAVLH